MGEKRGDTGKLLNPYNDNGVLEIFYDSLDTWVRVTSNDFRSWGGKRRITSYTNHKRGEEATCTIEEYHGPVYEYKTNTKVKKLNSKGLNGSRVKAEPTLSENMKILKTIKKQYGTFLNNYSDNSLNSFNS